MIHFKAFGWRVSLRVHRPRKLTREQLEQAGVIVCGPDIEAQMLADSDREMHEYGVLMDLYERVQRDIDARIADTHMAGEYQFGAPHKRVREFLRDLRDIASRMDAAPAAGPGEGEG